MQIPTTQVAARTINFTHTHRDTRRAVLIFDPAVCKCPNFNRRHVKRLRAKSPGGVFAAKPHQWKKEHYTSIVMANDAFAPTCGRGYAAFLVLCRVALCCVAGTSKVRDYTSRGWRGGRKMLASNFVRVFLLPAL